MTPIADAMKESINFVLYIVSYVVLRNKELLNVMKVFNVKNYNLVI